MLSEFQNCLVLTGPTASGKSAIAMEFAERAGAEILAMDSMTLYRGMDIGTAKPTLADRRKIPHHLIDLLDPTETASVAWWLKEAAAKVQEIESRGRLPLFVGGTPFYLKAMVHGLFEGPRIDADIRLELEERAERGDLEALHRELSQVDPTTAARLHPNDARRVIRALEVYRQMGQPMSSLQQQQWFERKAIEPPQLRGCPQIVRLDLPREELYARIDSRVEEMIRSGWLEEVRLLHENYPNLGREASQAVGYRILKNHLDGKIDLKSAVEMIQMKTRRFAKHQLTWFRNSPFSIRSENTQVLLIWEPFLL